MMISRFINISNKLLIQSIIAVNIFTCHSVFSMERNAFYLPDKTGYIFWRCNNNICDTYLNKNSKKSIIMIRNAPPPSIVALKKDLIKLFFSCGSPCNYTMYYNSTYGVSKAFEFVMAIDLTQNQIIAIKGNQLIVYRIFDPSRSPLFKIKRNWSPAATLFNNIIEVKFKNKSIYLKYLEGINFHEKEELIYI